MKSKLLIGAIVLVTGIAIVGVRSYIGMENASADYKIEGAKVVEVPKEATKPLTKVYDKEIGVWASKINAMLSAPLNDPRLKEANNDEGFEYYLKAQKVMDLYPNQNPLDPEFEIDFVNLQMLSSRIEHYQFVRTAHLDSYGQAKEDTSISEKWKPIDNNMRQAFEYMKQLSNDLDVIVNHDGEGKTFGVTHLLNGGNASEMEAFITGQSSIME